MCLVASVVSDSFRSVGIWFARLLCPWEILQARILEWAVGCVPSSRGSPDPGIEPASLALAGSFFITSTTWEAQEEDHGKRKRKSPKKKFKKKLNFHSFSFVSSKYGPEW